MNKLFLFLLFSLSIYGQSKYLTGTLPNLEVRASGKYFVISVTDSADTFTDTLKVEIHSAVNDTYNLVGVQDLYTGDFTTFIIPGDGQSKRYLINEPYPTKVKITRTNVSNTSRRTFVWIISKG